jgi:hypothetical protein
VPGLARGFESSPWRRPVPFPAGYSPCVHALFVVAEVFGIVAALGGMIAAIAARLIAAAWCMVVLAATCAVELAVGAGPLWQSVLFALVQFAACWVYGDRVARHVRRGR